MSWKDRLIQASFKGAFFHVRSSDYSVGRRNALYQYPFKDLPYTEDMGADIDEFVVEGYIIANAENGFDYFKERNKLITALKSKGPGKLIHPYYGEKNVVLAQKARIRESFSEGGIVIFSMIFMIAGEKTFPIEDVDPISEVDYISNTIRDYTVDSFYKQYSITSSSNNALPGFLATSIVDDFNSYISMAKSVVNNVRNTASAALERVKSLFDNLRDLMLDAARTPCQIAGYAVDAVDSILNIANIINSGYLGEVIGECSKRVLETKLSPTGKYVNYNLGKSMINSFLEVAGESLTTGFGTDINISTSIGGAFVPIEVTTVTRAYQASNRLSFVNMIRALNVTSAAQIAIRTQFRTFTESKEAQDRIVNSIDSLLIKLGDESASDPYADFGVHTDNHDIYSKLEELRAIFVRAMRVSQLTLVKEIIYEVPPYGSTSLQLAYELYGDIERSEEIFERNQPNITHPAFFNGSVKVMAS